MCFHRINHDVYHEAPMHVIGIQVLDVLALSVGGCLIPIRIIAQIRFVLIHANASVLGGIILANATEPSEEPSSTMMCS